MKRLSVVLALMSSLAGAAERPDVPAQLTIRQALEIALSNSNVLREAHARLDQASGRHTQARSALLPQIDIGIRQSIQTINLIGIGVPVPGVTGKIGPFGSLNARVYLTQELLNFASRREWESSRFRVDSSRLMIDNARELVSLDVIATYLEALRAKTKRDSLAAQTGLASELHKIATQRVAQGVSAELDANRAMQQVNNLLQQRQEAEQNYVAAKLALVSVIQARPSDSFEVADTAAYGEGPAPERESALKAALAARADYRAAAANLKAAELQIQSAKAGRLPTLTLNADNGQMGNSPAHNINTYRVQGSLDIPVFTGGRTRGEIEEAEGALRQARTVLDQNRTRIETDVLTAISGVEWALKEVDTSVSNVKLSRQEVELTRALFVEGVSDNTEVVNAQDRLERAEDANIRAQYLLGLARANLARATGAAEKTYLR